MSVSVSYGQHRQLELGLPTERLVAYHPSPEPISEVLPALLSALAEPLDFPPLSRAVVPGDRVVLALDRYTPQAATLIAGVWQVLHAQGVEADQVLILQPTALSGPKLADPRVLLPEGIRDRVGWRIHDATDSKQQAYLATTANDERIYLARDVVEADLVISIGQIAYDPVMGFRGTNSVFYPGLSSTAAVKKARGFGHQELTPDDERPLRQLVEEIGWLLGVQFSIQVLPARGDGISAVLAGLEQSVRQRGRELLIEQQQIEITGRADTVVISVDADAAGHGWDQIGAALSTARSLVSRGGKVIILSDLNGESSDLSDGMQIVRDSGSPREALKPLRVQVPPDYLPATQLAQLADWSRVYLLSRLDSGLVEDLFMTPLETEKEVNRLLETCENCAVIEGAQHTHGLLHPARENAGGQRHPR